MDLTINNLEMEAKVIRNELIKSFSICWFPMISLGLILPEETSNNIENYSPAIEIFLIILFLVAFISLCCGYGMCCNALYQYAKHKGYSKYIGIFAAVFNIYGLCFLFLLDNKRVSQTESTQDNNFKNFSILSIFISFLAILIFLMPFFIIAIAIGGNIGIEKALEYFENKDVGSILDILCSSVFIWYFFKKIKQANINLKHLIGSVKKISFKLPLSLAIAKFFFAWGFNSFTLYGLSFIVPNYVENCINQEHTATYIGFSLFAIGSIFFAPIWEEIFFRGIIFQKLAIKKSFEFSIAISSLIFAIIHFRYDIIPLTIGGIIYVLLYLKTKQLIVPILSHFFYNTIVVLSIFHYQFLSNSNHLHLWTITDYQQYFIDRIGSRILFIALSAPYLIYFIYKNFPRNDDKNNLPYIYNRSDFTKG